MVVATSRSYESVNGGSSVFCGGGGAALTSSRQTSVLVWNFLELERLLHFSCIAMQQSIEDKS